jgi:hypothetical protein
MHLRNPKPLRALHSPHCVLRRTADGRPRYTDSREGPSVALHSWEQPISSPGSRSSSVGRGRAPEVSEFASFAGTALSFSLDQAPHPGL